MKTSWFMKGLILVLFFTFSGLQAQTSTLELSSGFSYSLKEKLWKVDENKSKQSKWETKYQLKDNKKGTETIVDIRVANYEVKTGKSKLKITEEVVIAEVKNGLNRIADIFSNLNFEFIETKGYKDYTIINFAIVKKGEEDNKGYSSVAVKVVDDKISVSVQVGTLYHSSSAEAEKILLWHLKKIKYSI